MHSNRRQAAGIRPDAERAEGVLTVIRVNPISNHHRSRRPLSGAILESSSSNVVVKSMTPNGGHLLKRRHSSDEMVAHAR